MTRDEYLDHLADLAMDLACRVRDDDPAAVRRWLDATVPAEQRTDLLIALAAAVPTDRTWPDLIGWTDERPVLRELRPHGTPAAAQRHRYHREALCDVCRESERARDRDRKRLARAGPVAA